MRSQKNIFGIQNPQILITFVAAVVTVTCFTSSFFGQSVKPSDYKADQVLKSNARVNPTSKAMELSIPIGGYGGRAGNGLPVAFNYSSKVWQMETTLGGPFEFMSGTKTALAPLYGKRTAAGWSSNLGSPTIEFPPNVYEGYRIGSMYDGQMYQPMICTSNCSSENYPIYYVKRVQIVMPDGSSHEFRKDDTIYSHGSNQAPGTQDMTGTFLSVDASRMRLDIGTTSATLFLPDGSRYLFGTPYNGLPAHTLIDRHGNKMAFNTTTRTWTDTIGRVIIDPLPHNGDSQTQTVGTVEAEFPGLGSETLDVDFVWVYLKDPSTSVSVIDDPDNTSQTLYYGSDYYCTNGGAVGHYYRSGEHLFNNPESTSTWICSSATNRFNPIVLSHINLANGQSYQFKYNAYGEITKILYPSGGYERFKYAQVGAVQPSGPSYDQANRGVTDRWISEKGDGTDEIHWQYGNSSWTTTAPDGTRTEQSVYSEGENAPQPYGFGNAKTGRTYEERSYSSTNQLLARKLTDYETTGSGLATRDLRPTKEVSIIFEPGNSNAFATMTETIYDTTGHSDPAYFSSLNPKQQKTYQYVVVNSATAITANITTAAGWFSAATPAVVTEMDYLYDANYKARNINGLVTGTRVEDANGIVKAKTQISYDEVMYLESASITTAPGWENPNTSYRGLATSVRSWTDIAGNQYIETNTLYDQFGNVRKTWDGNDNVSEIQYTDNFSDSTNRNSYAYPTKTISPIPGGNGSTSAFETTIKYDFNTGLPTSSVDANGLESRMEYDDPLFRPTKASTWHNSVQVGGETITEYGAGTSPSTRWVKSKSQIDATNWKEGYTYFDGLGRTVRTQSVDNDGDVFVLTCYDNMSRPLKTTNPFRGYTNQDCATTTGLEWTSNTYDTAGRPWKVKTPDNAEVVTSYGLATTGSTIGTSVTVTDQAGKLRRSVTNALGQLKRVDEPNASNQLGAIDNPNQWTGYSYDLLNNLIIVNQGDQTRSFTYDALSRLKSATNPESGTINYAYDNNGNLTSKVDARTITTAYTYDALNRVTQRAYTNEPTGSETPDVTYFYDNLTNAKGKLLKVSSSVSTTEYVTFDILGRVTRSKQTTDGVVYGDDANPMTYTYNLSGALIEQTYPSGRVVKNVLDNNGDLSIVQSKKSSNHGFWNYAQHFTFNAAGAVTSLQLGNSRWECTTFNSRLQPTQIALGTVQNGTDKLDLDFGYGTTANNGNVVSQTITVPTAGSYTGFTATQTYTYDSLNRIKDATEIITGQTPPSWKQTFTYDRYGNRNFDQANTTQPASFVDPNVTNPTISTYNNRFASGQGYSYDSSGNTTQDALGRTFIYDAENKQIEVIENSVTIGEYFYDGEGKRVKKLSASETTIFVYNAMGNLIAEYSNQTVSNPQVSYLTTDNLGTPRINTDANGQVISRHDYMPFGEESFTSQRTSNLGYVGDNVKQGFTGYFKDNETSLDFAQARMYGSTYGRFTSPDPTLLSVKSTFPQTWNRYAYVTNNPLRYVDPLGLWALVSGYYLDKDGNRKRGYAFVKTKKGDDAASLVKQLGFDPKDKGIGQGLSASISSSLGKNNAIGLSNIDTGGKVGGFLSTVEKKLVAQDEYDKTHRNEDGSKTTGGPDDKESFDCGSTTCRLSFPNEMATLGEKANDKNFDVNAAEKMISELTTPVKSENDLRTGDVLRYGKGADRHFGNFVYKDDNGVPKIFSRLGQGNSFAVHPINDASVTGFKNRGGVNGMFRPK